MSTDTLTALVVRDDARMTFNFTAAARKLADDALAKSALVARVTDGDQQKDAVAALQEIVTVLAAAEKARQSAKDPVIQFGRKIDAAAKQFVEELNKEKLRLNILIGDFQQLEEARIRAAQQAENERLAAIERERAKELAKAESHEQMDSIQAKYHQIVAEQAAPIAPAPRETGQTVSKDWNIEVYDIYMLARAHPGCVKIEPLLNEIKSLLKAGATVAGVRAKLVTKVTVRSKVAVPAIDV